MASGPEGDGEWQATGVETVLYSFGGSTTMYTESAGPLAAETYTAVSYAEPAFSADHHQQHLATHSRRT